MRLRRALPLLLSLLAARASSPPLAHPGVFLSSAQLAFVRAQLAAGAEPFASALAKARGSAYGSLDWALQGPPASGVIDCGGYDRPDHGCSAEDSDAVAAYTHALLYSLGGGASAAAHAATAARIMDAYAGVRLYNNSNAPLQAAWSASKWSRAAELLRHGGGGASPWPPAAAAAFSAFLVRAALPLIANETAANGNWATAMIEGLAGIAVLTDDAALLARAAGFWRSRLPAYVYLAADGAHPVPAPRRPGGQGPPNTHGWYGQAVFNATSEGVAQETCRDLEHTQMGLASAANAAETLRAQGIDVLAEAGGAAAARLRAAMELHSRVLLGALGREPPAWLCRGVLVDANVTYPSGEVAYFALHDRLDLALPATLQLLETRVRAMPLPVNRWMSAWETLTHG